MRVPFARGNLGFVEVAILRLGDMLARNERARRRTSKR